MKKTLLTVMKILGYLSFFIFSLLIFVYLTLPMEQVKAYVVRTASSQLDADLEIEELTTWGLTGIEAKGVVLTLRPTAEEREEIRVARAARRDWEERKRLQAEADARRKAAETVEDDDGAPTGGASTDDDIGIVGKSTFEKEEEAKKAKAAQAAGKSNEKSAADSKESKPKKNVTKAEDKPPEIPRGPGPIAIESLRMSVYTLGLLADLFDGKLFNKTYAGNLQISALGGQAAVEIENHETRMTVKGDANDLDLRQLSGLKRFVPLPIAGALRWSIDLELPRDKKGKLRLSKAEGAVSLNLDRSSVGPGKLKSDALRSLGGSVDVPKLTLKQFGGRLNFEKRRATFEDFAFDGKDVEGSLEGYIQLADSFSRWGPRAFLRFKFSDGFLDRESAVRTLVKTLPYVKRGTAADGFTGFTVTGRLDKPTWRPRKKNPYETRKARPKPASKDRKSLKSKRSTQKPRATKGKIKRRGKTQARSQAGKKIPTPQTASRPKRGGRSSRFNKKSGSSVGKSASTFKPPRQQSKLTRNLDGDEDEDEDEEEDEGDDDEEDEDEDESEDDEDDDEDDDAKEEDERDEADAAEKEKIEREEGEAEAENDGD